MTSARRNVPVRRTCAGASLIVRSAPVRSSRSLSPFEGHKFTSSEAYASNVTPTGLMPNGIYVHFERRRIDFACFRVVGSSVKVCRAFRACGSFERSSALSRNMRLSP